MKRKKDIVKEDSVMDLMMKARGQGSARNRVDRGRKGSEPQTKVNPVELFIEERVRNLLKSSKELLTGG